ncbi:DNA repair protein RecO, partial [Halomonas sp. BBD48]|nr:DNA repair protein RecO [Halomonas sp. BBD48]
FYTSLLEALPAPERRAPGLRRLELAVLEALDADPVFRDIEDRELDPQGRYVYRAGYRRFETAPDGQGGVDGRSLRLLAQGDWTQPGLAGVAKALTRAALSPLLGDKPLRSRELMYRLAARRRPS